MIHVQIGLLALSDQQEDFAFVLLFDREPDQDDILRAFLSDPVLSRLEGYILLHSRLRQYLNTFGVPKLGQVVMINEKHQRVLVPRVCAEWTLNLADYDNSSINRKVGWISVSNKTVNEVPRPAEPIQKFEEEVPATKQKPVKKEALKEGSKTKTRNPGRM